MNSKEGREAPKRILIAEDEPAIRSLIGRFLEQLGYSVKSVEDGVQACEAADTESPDLVILDLMLPRKDGYAVLLHLRSRPATAETPVIFISGEPPGEHLEISKTLGAQGFLPKPFTAESLGAVVRSAMRDRVERSVVR